MTVFSLCGFAVLSTLLCSVLKTYRSELYPSVAAACVTATALFAVTALSPALGLFSDGVLAKITGAKTVVKILGVCYFCSLSADLCRQSGEAVLAKNLELAGKCVVCALCVPMVTELIGLLSELTGG